jgi:hypothetical protein
MGLVSSLLVALPANADDSYASPGHWTEVTVDGQNLVVSAGAAGPAAHEGSYGAAGESVSDGHVAVTSGGSTNVDWAQVVLEDGGWPTSANNITVITQWMNSENGAQSWWNRNNPLNNGYGSGGGSGFGSYSNLLVAAAEVAANLHRGSSYASICSDLAASAPAPTTAEAIWASAWAGSHYDNGRLWHAQPIPTVAAPASAW